MFALITLGNMEKDVQKIAKILGVLAAVAVGLSLSTGCNRDNGETTPSNMKKIENVVLWKEVGKLGTQDIVEIAYSAPNTYASTADNLYWLKSDGTWAAVDVTKGNNHGGKATVSIPGVSKLTALSGGRIVATTTAMDVIIVEAGETTDFWAAADAGITKIGANAIKSIAVVNDSIVISDGTPTLKAQFYGVAGKFIPVWDGTLAAKNGVFAKNIGLLAIDTAGDLYVGQNETTFGFYKFAKANVVAGGKAEDDNDKFSLSGLSTNLIWNDKALPKGIVFTAVDEAVVNGNLLFGFLKKGEIKNDGAAAAIDDNKGAAIAGITSIKGAGDKVYAFSAAGMYIINQDGKVTDDIFAGAWTGHNYEHKSADDFAKIKEADLKTYNFGTTDISCRVSAGDTTYFITADKGVFAGTMTKSIKVLK